MTRGSILWADDEIDLLRPHIMFLEERGYEVTPVTNGDDAISMAVEERYDLVLMDQMMSGRDGLSTVEELKTRAPGLPVIMITKHEEESMMEEAIGGNIADYLTKPVNPSQILLACKKILEGQKIAGERLARDYTTEFTRINDVLSSGPSIDDWIKIHTDISQWEVELDEHPDLGFRQMLVDQKRECNVEFGKFIERDYSAWVTGERTGTPTLSVDIVPRYLYPLLSAGEEVVFVVIDCMRLDQWIVLEPFLYDYFNITKEYYCSILPTATPFSRNAIFSGYFPRELSERHPEMWEKALDDEMSMNRDEHSFLNDQLERLQLELKSGSKYVKILDIEEGKNVERQAPSYKGIPLVSLVVNFVDILSHSRSDSEVLREIAPDESGYRSLTASWFEHSWLFNVLKTFSSQGKTVILTTDHGSVRVLRGTQVIGDRETSTNLRYKFGRSLKCDDKDAVLIKEPADWNLPNRGVNTNYIFARSDYFFLYPNNYNKYLRIYRDTFQHGGITMEEMILPVITLRGKE